MYSYSIIDAEKVVPVPPAKDISELLLDERHLSKSALRALDVLEFFSTTRRPARAVEVAQALSMSASSTDQLLKTLVSRAYLSFDVQRKIYFPSPRLLGFASLLESTYFGGDNLQNLMRDLKDRTGFAVSISTPFGRWMQLVDFVVPEGQSYDRQPGHLFPLISSAAGSAVLATWPLSSVRSLVEQSQDQLGALRVDCDMILARLADVRANGHAFGGLRAEVDKCSIAVALPRAGFGTELALAVRGPTEALKARRWRIAASLEEAVARHLAQERSGPERAEPHPILADRPG